jgi:hypothetical protein
MKASPRFSKSGKLIEARRRRAPAAPCRPVRPRPPRGAPRCAMSPQISCGRGAQLQGKFARRMADQIGLDHRVQIARKPAMPPSLPRPPAIQRIRGKARSACAALSGIRRLRIVDEPHAVDFGHHLAAMRQSGKAAESRRDLLRGARPSARKRPRRLPRSGGYARPAIPRSAAQIAMSPPACPAAFRPETPCACRPTSPARRASAPRDPDHRHVARCLRPADWPDTAPSASSTPITARSGPPSVKSRRLAAK